MKKILLLTIVLFAILDANAQQFFGARRDFDRSFRPRFGFTIGAAFSNAVLTNKSDYNVGSTAGYNVGFTYLLPVSDRLSAVSELLYSQKGYKANTQAGNYSQRTQFLDVPLLIKYHTARKLDLFVGPQFSYLLSAGNNYADDFNRDVKRFYDYDGIKGFVAAVMGVGYDINESIDVHARYAIDIKGNSANGNIHVPGYRNQALQMAFGFKF